MLKHLHVSIHSVCNQPRRLRKHSNPVVVFITTERLGVSPAASIIDLEQDSQLPIIELSDDTAPLSGRAISSDSNRATGNHHQS